MKTWRLVKSHAGTAFENMSVDEAILRSRIGNLVPNTVRLYEWKPSAVSIGRFQDVQKEVHMENCKKHGVDVVRRLTGGGTVFHAEKDEITYSIVARKEDLADGDISAVYSKIYSGIANALQVLGLKTDFNAGNEKVCPNLTVKGKKVSGSAQAHRKGVILQHGTLLLRVDLNMMFAFLRVPWAESCMQVADVARQRITSVSTELKRTVSTQEVSCALTKGFEQAFGAELVPGSLTQQELETSRLLSRQKYATEEWNLFGRSILENMEVPNSASTAKSL